MLIFILDIFECSKDTRTLVKSKANGPNYKHRVWALTCIITVGCIIKFFVDVFANFVVDLSDIAVVIECFLETWRKG